MKYYLIVFLFLFGSSLYSQENTILLSDDDIAQEDESSFEIIEHVPIYKGCEKEVGNRDKKKCMSQKISQLFQDNFNTTIPENSDMEPGLWVVTAKFIIDSSGNIKDITTETESEFLKTEAKRVIQLIPRMTPGKVRGVPVSVPYTIPIKINLIRKSNKSLTFPVHKRCNSSFSYERQRKCTTQEIMDFVKVSVDYDLASALFPTDTSTQFQMDFTIDKKGKFKNITAKAHKKEMATEAIRVLKRHPKLKMPGSENDIPIDTPISFLMTIYFN